MEYLVKSLAPDPTTQKEELNIFAATLAAQVFDASVCFFTVYMYGPSSLTNKVILFVLSYAFIHGILPQPGYKNFNVHLPRWGGGFPSSEPEFDWEAFFEELMKHMEEMNQKEKQGEGVPTFPRLPR